MDELADFLEALGVANSLPEMEAAFSRALERLGVSRFTYQIVRASGSVDELPPDRISGGAEATPGLVRPTLATARLRDRPDTAFYVITTYPTSWAEHYLSQRYYDDDPVVAEAQNRRLPFRWSSIARPEGLKPLQRRLMSEAGDAGLRNGVTIPLTGQGVEAAAASFIAPGADAHSEAFLDHHQHLLHLMAMYFHHRAGSALLQASLIAPSSRRRSILTDREREVLEWIARGKSGWEIAAILAISEKSVEFHVDGAKRKLQVFNRTHLVVKALMMGLISVG